MKKSILLYSLAFIFTTNAMAQDSKVTPAATAVAPAANKNQSEMKFDALEYDYGTIKQGDKVEHTFTFTNAGKEPLIITNAQGSCGCTAPEYSKEPIRKGEKGMIKVTFNSAGKMGMQDKTVTVTSNAKNSPVILHIKGTIEAAAPSEPAKESAH